MLSAGPMRASLAQQQPAGKRGMRRRGIGGGVMWAEENLHSLPDSEARFQLSSCLPPPSSSTPSSPCCCLYAFSVEHKDSQALDSNSAAKMGGIWLQLCVRWEKSAFGHTEQSICHFVCQKKFLFSSRSILNVYMNRRRESMQLLRASIRSSEATERQKIVLKWGAVSNVFGFKRLIAINRLLK